MFSPHTSNDAIFQTPIDHQSTGRSTLPNGQKWITKKVPSNNSLKDAETQKGSVILLQEGSEVLNAPSSITIQEYIMVDNIRITPKYMEFKDSSEGMTFRQQMTILNIGSKPAFIRICSPNSIAFKIQTLEQGRMLNPGLKIKRWLHYSFKRPSLLHALIPIEINGTAVDYHVVCTLAMENIIAEPTSVDFGIVDIGCSSETKTVTLRNMGGKSARFSIDLGKNNLDITCTPMRGIVRPYGESILTIMLIGTNEGSFYSEFWIKSSPNIRVPVTVDVIIPRLAVHHSNTSRDFTLLNFATCFIDSERYEVAILRNLSSQITSFVVLGEVSGGLIPIQDINRKKHPAYEAFKIYPQEGRMEPFEGVIFNVTFSPTAEMMKYQRGTKNQEYWEFAAFIRILRVHGTEIEDIIGANNSRRKSDDKKERKGSVGFNEFSEELPLDRIQETARLCLYAKTEKATLSFVPDELNLGDMKVGEIAQRVICITNPSKNTPLSFQFVQNVAQRCNPEGGRLKPGGSIEVLLRIESRLNVPSPAKVLFDVLIDTYSKTPEKKRITIKATTCFILCWLNPITMVKEQRTNFGVGITPLITNEVGLCPEKATFGSDKKKPRQATLLVQNDVTKVWANDEFIRSHDFPDSLPAFPNDTRQSLRPWAGSAVRMVYRGKLRYVASPDFTETLTPEEVAYKTKERLYWAKYLRTMQMRRDKLFSLKEAAKGKMSESLPCGDGIGIPKSTFDSLAKRLLERANIVKTLVTSKSQLLIPLSPTQIYNIKVRPTVLSYGEVAPRSCSYRHFIVENMNSFSVKVHMTNGMTKFVSFPEGHTMVIRSNASSTKLVELRAEDIGKINSHIGYVINGYHSFELAVTADVVPKYLSLGVRKIVFRKEYLPIEAYRPAASFVEIRNRLDAKTCFRWDVPDVASFIVEPLTGTVRGNRNLFVDVHYEPDVAKSHNADIVLHNEGGTRENLTLQMPMRKPKVSFVENVLELNNVPLNIATSVTGVLYNEEFTDVVFDVDSASLIHGCEVHPCKGVIPPRGIGLLRIQLKFEVCFDFNITIRVTVQKCLTLMLKLKGTVSFPILKLSPSRISIGCISVDAFQTYSISATNAGSSILNLQFDLEEYPEFRVSFSSCRMDSEIDKDQIVTIAARETVTFYLHFVPVDLSYYSFYLPIVINELLGPVQRDDEKTRKPLEFLKSRDTVYADTKEVTLIAIPSKLSTIFIECVVTGHVISFNKLIFNFDVVSSYINDELRAFNASKREVSFILRIDNFTETNCPFSIKWIDGVEPTMTPVSIVCTLKPEEETLFLIRFEPSQFGSFSLAAPIFVRGEMEGRMFNQLLLSGENPAPFVDSDFREIYFGPLPLDVEAEKRITLKVKHFRNPATIVGEVITPRLCSGRFTDDTLKVEFPEGNVVPDVNRSETLKIVIVFKSNHSVSFRTKIKFSHEENLTPYFVTVCATADNSLLTIHAYLCSSNKHRKMGKSELPSSFLSFASEDPEVTSTAKQQLTYIRKQEAAAGPKVSSHSNTSQFSKMTTKGDGIPTSKATIQTIDEKREVIDEREIDLNITSKTSFPLPEEFTKTLQSSKQTFPSLPMTDINDHTKRTTKIAEEWVYSVPLMFSFYPSISDGMTAAFSGLCPAKNRSTKKKSPNAACPSFVDVLENIVGPDIFKYIGEPDQLPEDASDRIAYVMKLYENILLFLTGQGACLPHVTPELLLNYNDYLSNGDPAKTLSKNIKKSTFCEKMSYQLFETCSKQCWLDVILQTFKVLVLRRISIYSFQRQRRSTSLHSTNLSSSYWMNDKVLSAIEKRATVNVKNPGEESLLLAWLEYHFEEERKKNWMTDRQVIMNPNEKRDVLEPRSLKNYGTDLSDGLVLIAVTGAYCSYVIEDYFKNIYIYPRSAEEVMHNAICVVNSWRSIRLGFMVTPADIVRPNCIQMLMLITYLFETLPTYTLEGEVKFQSPLTEKTTRQISFTNTSDVPVTYLLQFLGNNSGTFRTALSQSVLHINPRDTSLLKLQYHAKTIKDTEAFLILCGSSVAPHFARNHAFLLKGAPSQLDTVKTYSIRSKLYSVVNETLSIAVPYKQAAEYEIWISEEKPIVPTELKMIKWSELRARNIPRRLFVNQKSLLVLENDPEVNLSVTVACIVPVSRSFWLIFQSEVGDFIIEIKTVFAAPAASRLTVMWERKECICPDPPLNLSADCSLSVDIMIPSRNVQLWKCISEMFQKTLSPKERTYWSHLIDTSIGMRLMYWFMGDHNDSAARECNHIFNTNVTYATRVSDKSTDLTVPAEITIPDVRPLEEYAKMTVHLSQSTPQLYQTKMILTSQDKLERRIYKIDFHCDTPPISPIPSISQFPSKSKRNATSYGRKATTLK